MASRLPCSQHERFVSIDAPTVVFDDTSGAGDGGMEFRPFDGRGLPFTQVDAVPTEWIPIDTVELQDGAGAIPGVFDLIVKATGQPLIAAFDATDRAGNGNIGFSTPATFVDENEAFTTGAGSALERLATFFADTDSAARRTLDLAGQAVAFADEIAEGLGKTTFATNQIVLNLAQAIGATSDGLSDAVRLGVFPAVESARIVDEAITAALGGDALDLAVTLHERWLASGLEAANFDLAFLLLDEAAEKALGGAGRAVAAVDLVAKVFNQTVGAGLDLGSPNDVWSPEEALGGDSRILGMIPLRDILPSIDLADAIPGVDIPGLEVSVDENGLKATFTFTPGGAIRRGARIRSAGRLAGVHRERHVRARRRPAREHAHDPRRGRHPAHPAVRRPGRAHVRSHRGGREHHRRPDRRPEARGLGMGIVAGVAEAPHRSARQAR